MGRRSRKRPWGQQRPLDMTRLGALPRAQTRCGFEYHVQYLSSAAKTYTCPGCFGSIAPGSAHVVAWRIDTFTSAENQVEARRHWHRACWERGL